MGDKLNVGVIGAGRMAKYHLEVLSVFEDINIKSIATTKTSQKKHFEIINTYKILNHYSDFTEMLNNENLNCVFIAVSVEKMYEVTKYVLSKGVHSFVEKPPGLYLNETKELAKIADEKSIITAVGLQRRFYSHIKFAKDYIESNGKLVSVVVEAPEKFAQIKSKEKFSEEVLSRWIIANGIHCLDLLLYFGGDIKSFKIIGKKCEERIHPDSLNSLIEFENGSTGHYISNWMSPGGWSVKLYCNGFRIDIQPLEEGKIIFPCGTEKPLPINKIDKKFKPGVYEQDRLFLNSIQNNNRNVAPCLSLSESVKLMSFCENFLT